MSARGPQRNGGSHGPDPYASQSELRRLLALINAAAAAAEEMHLDKIFIALRYLHADAVELVARRQP